MSLAERLRKVTGEVHRAAEQAGIMQHFLRRAIDLRAYCLLLRNLYEIYAALEDALRRNALHAQIAPVYFPQLWRRDALAGDLDALHGNRWDDELAVVPGTAAYVQHLRDVERDEPQLLVAHAYVRYLGDLNGGQVLRELVIEMFDLQKRKATAFYDFSGAGIAAELINRYRAGLDAIPLDAAARERIVAEAQLAFALHRRLFEELDCLRRAPVEPRLG